MQNLYRVHARDNRGRGMYRCTSVSYCMTDVIRHPAPEDDGLFRHWWNAANGVQRSQLLFGFATLEQFTSWVYDPDWWTTLKEQGCVMSVFNVPDEDFILGYTQAAARLTGLKPIKTVEVPDWEQLRDVTI